MSRAISADERAFIERVAERLGGPQASQLGNDLRVAFATPTADGARVLFEIPGYARPVYEGQRPFGAEGKLRDSDGVEITVCLYADENGRLFELELIRWDDGAPINPDWSTLEVY